MAILDLLGGRRAWLGALGLALFVSGLPEQVGASVPELSLRGAGEARGREARIDQCAQVTGGVRMEAYGYTHLVGLKNRCDKPVLCEVWTDVDPTPHHTLRAGPGENDEVITRRGSPAREVSAEASCRFE